MIKSLFYCFLFFSTDEDARQAMMLNGAKLKETQVSLLLSSRAEMQKVIETARQQTISFMNFSTQQPTVTATPSLPVITPQMTIPGIQAQASVVNGSNAVVGLITDQQLPIPKPQPPIITSSSLSGILAQQMLQQHQIQLIRQQQNMPVLTSTSVRHDAYKMHNQYNSMTQQYGDNSMDSTGKNIQSNDSKRNRNSRSRSRSRDRRDRKRSRSRERSRRYRDRSRSRERRRRRRSPSSDRRSRSHGRERTSRDNVRKDRSYEKEQRPLDRNKSVDESKPNFNASMENNFNAQGGVADGQNSLNYPDMGSTNNFSTEVNDGFKAVYSNYVNPSRIDYPSNILGNDFEPAMPMIPFKENDATNVGCCVRITNMNNKTHYAAIRKFFYGLQIPNDGIKLLNDENGRRRNDVVIRFARPDIARDAVSLDGKMLNGNCVRITPIGDGEYENEVDSFQPPRRPGGSRFGNRYDDRNFSGDNRGGSEENNSRDGNYRRNNRDYDRGYQRNRYNDDSDGHGNHSNDSRDRDDDVMLITDSNDGDTVQVGTTLLIEDLPPFAKEQDIIKMFSDFTLMDIMLTKINKVFLAYVKFHNQSDAEAALKQTHMHRIDFKSVFVSACTEETYEKAKQEYEGLGDISNKVEVSLFFN